MSQVCNVCWTMKLNFWMRCREDLSDATLGTSCQHLAGDYLGVMDYTCSWKKAPLDRPLRSQHWTRYRPAYTNAATYYTQKDQIKTTSSAELVYHESSKQPVCLFSSIDVWRCLTLASIIGVHTELEGRSSLLNVDEGFGCQSCCSLQTCITASFSVHMHAVLSKFCCLEKWKCNLTTPACTIFSDDWQRCFPRMFF